MKMETGFFWGAVLIVLGVCLILRIFFNISISRILVAFILIFIGIKLLIGRKISSSLQDENQVIGGTRVYKTMPRNNSDYNTIFSKTTYDFRELDTLALPLTKISFNTVFGNTEILLPKCIHVQVRTDAVFASSKMPNGNSIAFGTANYISDYTDSATTQLMIDANVVFGSIEIKQ
jgi:predicted membrane protein